MKLGLIDVGSNSVRLLFDGKKHVNNTQLAENLMHTGVLSENPMDRTAQAIKAYVDFVEKNGGTPYAFATEAVRSAKNKEEFLAKVHEISGIRVEIIPPQEEARLGFMGAYTGGTQGVIDIGGASSELAIGDENGLVYAYSLPLGSVRLKDYENNDREKQWLYAKRRVKEYGITPKFDKLVAIGGTATQLCAVMQELEPYDPQKVHGTVMSRKDVEHVVNKIFHTPMENRKEIKGLHPKKILVTPSGGLILLAIMDYLGINEITVSENDNLEGKMSLLTNN